MLIDENNNSPESHTMQWMFNYWLIMNVYYRVVGKWSASPFFILLCMWDSTLGLLTHSAILQNEKEKPFRWTSSLCAQNTRKPLVTNMVCTLYVYYECNHVYVITTVKINLKYLLSFLSVSWKHSWQLSRKLSWGHWNILPSSSLSAGEQLWSHHGFWKKQPFLV